MSFEAYFLIHRRLEPHRQWHAMQLLSTGILLAGDSKRAIYSALMHRAVKVQCLTQPETLLACTMLTLAVPHDSA